MYCILMFCLCTCLVCVCVFLVGVCEVQDPQIAAWLLDPGDSAACFQELLNKHCRPTTYSPTHNFTLAQAPQKVSEDSDTELYS